MEGYSSTSLDQSAAKNFAYMSETDDLNPVLMAITLENETGKHYFSLDTIDYSCYPSEREILLQAGLIFKVQKVEEEDDLTIIHLYTSEKNVRTHERRHVMAFVIPLAAYLVPIFLPNLLKEIDEEWYDG